MRPEKLYLTDIVEAAQAIERFMMGEDFSEFEQNEMMQSEVLQKLSVIGEAASRLSKEFTGQFPEVPWFVTSLYTNILLFVGILSGLQQQKKSPF